MEVEMHICAAGDSYGLILAIFANTTELNLNEYARSIFPHNSKFPGSPRIAATLGKRQLAIIFPGAASEPFAPPVKFSGFNLVSRLGENRGGFLFSQTKTVHLAHGKTETRTPLPNSRPHRRLYGRFGPAKRVQYSVICVY